MAPNSMLFKVLAALFTLQTVSAFSPLQQPSTSTPTTDLVDKMSKFAMTAAVVISTSPLLALAEEVDDYEYGAVSAPISVAWVGGLFAVGTALLPLALQGGEEAFEEMKEQDAGKFGTGDSSALDRKRKRF
mmetsp:Transcript_17636/g.38531  ORF Transcript_17636/g.38531 Transcript_17636/m.38531 type:complete len:131 (+) Transcript_17636:147-539(+)|eukprot:CAMPEP_0168227882 /NCGR_PEP_ID=MMETSP0140_2-20121125/14312_1 /TAXON_ID=44445 /ORGANISM="Pseudo-nitzschia australis, Strain 10249 10 AB" /LENGTH=130 /DNA_ID=CAMNT_0008159323 /DNA_START=98 /DNA_END=490 /DNA_ORIENTATION=+